MKYFFDTEFVDGDDELLLISLGIVAQDGREFYRENYYFDPKADYTTDWLQKHVVPFLQGGDVMKYPHQIKDDLLEFIGDDKDPEFWAYFGAYDWVLLCGLFGRMLDLPKTWPMFVRDIQIVRTQMGGLALPPHTGNLHNALDDARWTKESFEYLKSLSRSSEGSLYIKIGDLFK